MKTNSLLIAATAILVNVCFAQDQADVHYVRDFAKTEVNNYKGVINDYNKAVRIKSKDQDVELFFNRGNIKCITGNYKAAITDYSKAIEKDPQNPALYLKRGLVKSTLKDYKEAIRDYSKTIELKPKEVSAYFYRAAAKCKLENYKEVIDDYNRAVKLSIKDAEIYFNRGLTKARIKDFKGAIEDYSKATKLDQKYAIAWFNRALAKTAIEDYKGAIKDYDKSITLNRNNVEILFNRAIAKCKLKDYKGAIADYTKIIKLDHLNTKAYYHRALANEETGYHARAVKDHNMIKYILDHSNPENIKFNTDYVEKFWAAYDESKSVKNKNIFIDKYYLKLLINPFGEDIVKAIKFIRKERKYYETTRNNLRELESLKREISRYLKKLKTLYPRSIFPDIYFMVGDINLAGVAYDTLVIIYLEAFNKPGISNAKKFKKQKLVIAYEYLPAVVIHEFIHIQSNSSDYKKKLLVSVIEEGKADFLTYIITGKKLNKRTHDYYNPVESKIWDKFKPLIRKDRYLDWKIVMDKEKLFSTTDYYLGYKICESYYNNASDKKLAIKEIIEIKDYKKFLNESGYAEKFKK